MNSRTFVAREQQLKQLDDKLALTFEGQGQVAFVSGDAGAGKTALIHHFVAQSQEKYPDLIVTLGNCDAHTGIGDPYLPFREAMGLLVGVVEGDSGQETITQENGKRIKNFMAESGRILLEVAPDLIGSFIPGGVLLSALGQALAVKTGIADKLDEVRKQEKYEGAIGQGISDQNQVFEQYTDYIQAIAKKHPLVIVIDDLHWVDAASAGLLFRLSRRNEEHPIFIVGTYRPTEVKDGKSNGSHPIASVLTDLKRYFGEISINLDKLEETEEKSFVDQLIDSEPNKLGEEFRGKLLRITNGHPLFTVELLRQLQERGGLLKDDNGDWIEGPELDWKTLPARVDGVIAGRVQRLDAKSQEILSVASVQGEEFIAEAVARVLSLEEKVVIRILSGDLSKVHQIVHLQSTQKKLGRRVSIYQFQHSLFQQYLQNSIDDAQKAILHEDSGLELVSLYGDETDEIAAQLAYHFAEAKEPEKTIRYASIAGDQAARLFAWEEAQYQYRRAIEAAKELNQSERFSELHELSARAYWNQGLYTQAIASIKKAIDFTGEKARKVEMKSFLGGVYIYIGDERGLSLLEEARQELNPKTQALALGNTLVWIGRHHHIHGHHLKALDAYQDAQNISDNLDDPGLQGSIFWFKAGAYQALAQYEQSNKWAHSSITYGQQKNSLINEAVGLEYLAENADATGRWKDAIKFAHQQIEVGVKIGDQNRIAWGHIVLTTSHHGLGDLAKAEQFARQTLDLAKLSGDRRLETLASSWYTFILCDLGSYEEAKEVALNALQLGEKLAQLIITGLSKTSMAYYHLLREEWREALDLLDAVSKNLEGSDSRWLQQYSIPLQAEALFGLEKLDKAGQLAEESYQSALKSGVLNVQADTQRILAQIHYSNEEYEEALQKVNGAIKVAKQEDYRLGLGRAYLWRAKILTAQGDDKLAREAASQAIDLFETCGAKPYLKKAQEFRKGMK